MTRREILRLGGSALLAGFVPSFARGTGPAAASRTNRLFFDREDIPRIRANTRTALLNPLFREWSAKSPRELDTAFATFSESGEMIRDFLQVLQELSHSATVQLVEPTAARQSSLLRVIEGIIEWPHWDYFMDGNQRIGIQRSSLATVNLLFAREVLDDALDEAFEDRLLQAIAEKGALPCYRTVYGMDHPETVKGWDFDEAHADHYAITMERWPMILGANNLRPAPAGALGLGALALRGRDPRAELWLQTAIDSSRRFFKLFTPDGSYFEGLSYVDYALRSSCTFLEAHYRLIGDIDWVGLANFEGVLHFILSMQAGRKSDGTPDIVNFSDARRSVFPCTPAWIGKHTGHPLAQYVVEEVSDPFGFQDFLWYAPDRPVSRPPESLKNVRNDLNWVLCRTGWQADDAVLAFRSGGPANHEHADRNHFLYKIYGERLLNDHFGASYDKREPGWTLRLGRAHNAVLVDGRGHPYIDGNEGTNDSQAYAALLQFVDRGDCVWWTSDATAAYILDNYHVTRVFRTVLFAKPDVVVVIDQIHSRYRPQTAEARFYPRNDDGKARLEVDGPAFTISRPRARLHGLVAGRSAPNVLRGQLEVPPEVGDYPCIRIASGEALTHEFVTVLAATPGASGERPAISAAETASGWEIDTPRMRARVATTGPHPIVEIL